RSSLIQKSRGIGIERGLRHGGILGWPILSRTLRKGGRFCQKKQNREKGNELHAEKTRALKKKGSAAPVGPQQSKGSGMSHPTRMGPTPALTQILCRVGTPIFSERAACPLTYC